MSRHGNCWDNAVAEPFFSSMKKERIKKRIYKKPAIWLMPTSSITSSRFTISSADTAISAGSALRHLNMPQTEAAGCLRYRGKSNTIDEGIYIYIGELNR
jgi:putative transposase